MLNVVYYTHIYTHMHTYAYIHVRVSVRDQPPLTKASGECICGSLLMQHVRQIITYSKLLILALYGSVLVYLFTLLEVAFIASTLFAACGKAIDVCIISTECFMSSRWTAV